MPVSPNPPKHSPYIQLSANEEFCLNYLGQGCCHKVLFCQSSYIGQLLIYFEKELFLLLS